MKKTAITCVFSNPQYAKTTPRGLELIYLKELLEEKNREVLIFGNKCRTNKDLDFFIDIKSIKDYDLDSIIIQLAPANFFGGVFSEYSVDAIKNLADIYLDKKVKFNIIPTDPRIKPVNPALIFSERFDMLKEYIDIWDEIIKESTYLFPGKNLNKFFDMDIKFNVFKLDWFAYIFKKGVNFSEFVDDNQKEFDVIYYGDKRGSHRNNKIKKYMPYSTKNLLLGYKEPKITYATFKNKVNHSELFEVLNKCKVSLIIGDKEHEDNVTTFRFYEALASSSLAAIDINFDPNKELIKNEKLREILYVDCMNDIKKLVNLYSEELILLQQLELKRIFNEIN
jgi:hypothetical protein